MQNPGMLRAGASAALGMSLCFCASAQAAPPKTRVGSLPASSTSPIKLGLQPPRLVRIKSAKALGLTNPPQITPWQQISVHSGDTLSGIFARAGLGASQWRALLQLGDATKALRHLHPGDTLDIRKTPSGKLAALRYKLDSLKTLQIDRQANNQSNKKSATFEARIDKRPTHTREKTATGTIGQSLSHALAAKGVPARIAARMSRIYRYRHNLQDLHAGDRFAVVYQTTYSNGQQIAAGPILAASITTNHRNYEAFRAQDKHGRYGYYDASGRPYKRAFSRKPVAYTRISSRFSMHRMNPITHKVRPHEGVDMAAPMGTPIHAAAEGTVKYAHWMHGYGRLVEIKNFDGYSTRYAHMHRIRHGLHVGEHVSKGEVIGYVGESGEATGPHLHFEIRRNGVAYNPLTVKLPNGHKLTKTRIAAFKRRIQPLIARLSPAPTTLLAKTASTPTNSDRCARTVALHTTLTLDLIGVTRQPGLDNLSCLAHHASGNA